MAFYYYDITLGLYIASHFILILVYFIKLLVPIIGNKYIYSIVFKNELNILLPYDILL